MQTLHYIALGWMFLIFLRNFLGHTMSALFQVPVKVEAAGWMSLILLPVDILCLVVLGIEFYK